MAKLISEGTQLHLTALCGALVVKPSLPKPVDFFLSVLQLWCSVRSALAYRGPEHPRRTVGPVFGHALQQRLSMSLARVRGWRYYIWTCLRRVLT